MNKLFVSLLLLASAITAQAVELTEATIVVNKNQPALVGKAASLLADDIERVSGIRPVVGNKAPKGMPVIQICVDNKTVSGWERYRISTEGNVITITGSDVRGAAYGALHVSEKIGVSPWYWFADVPVKHQAKIDYSENFESKSPSIKYRGVFINDEDWGMKTWASDNYEKELGDIGPKTYARVCELLLRLKANMLAPAMHSCTGAFYSHPESQKVAAEYGIMITTSHCEPLLFNNAAEEEWSKDRDGEWNYVTNKDVIYKKFDDRIRETAKYDNIYTMGMRGLHDEAMKGSTDNTVRARTLEKVFADQRGILKRHKKTLDVPQIFVPYKETLDIYDAGLKVPEDITIVWPDDNYGYMKRVSSTTEQQRKGGSGVYYHLSYLGTPHDYLWLPSTPPVLMYEELMKAYRAGADRYWLLNVGDIKPLEFEVQTFLDLAWDVDAYDIESINTAQAKWFASIFGQEFEASIQDILDTYMQLAWIRKPEYMGFDFQWSEPEYCRLRDSDFTNDSRYTTTNARYRYSQYARIAATTKLIMDQLDDEQKPAFFELLGYAVLSAEQMNNKFYYAQENHRTGSQLFAQKSKAAFDSINVLVNEYNTLLDGKWNQMMSEVPPGFVSLYQNMPELTTEPSDAYKLPEDQIYPMLANEVPLEAFGFPLIKGMGIDWKVLAIDGIKNATITTCDKSKLKVCVSVLPMWPLYEGVSNRFSVSVDGSEPVVCENKFEEWSYDWKLQVYENRKEFVMQFDVDPAKSVHTITISPIDPGQFVQKVTFE